MAVPTAVRDRSTVDLTDLKKRLGVDVSDYDTALERLLSVAKLAADQYCNNPFVEGVTCPHGAPLPIPEQVEAGLAAWVWVSFSAYLERRAAMASAIAGNAVSDPLTVATTTKTGDLSETRLFVPGTGTIEGIGGGLSGVDAHDRIKLEYWFPHRLFPLGLPYPERGA